VSESTPRVSLVPFTFSVWDKVVERIGPVSEMARRARNQQVRQLHASGFTVDQAAAVLADHIPGQKDVFDWALAAFTQLGACVDFCADVVEGKMDDKVLAMKTLLDSKLAMAELYHELSKIAELADVEGLPTPADTGRMVVDSQEEVERFSALIPPTS